MRWAVFVWVTSVLPAGAQVTFSNEISRILQAKCQRCHRPGDIAPFTLASYEDAASRGQAIRHAVENRIMPPWKPVPGHGEFRDSYALTAEERQAILDWVDSGIPEGNPADLPPPLPETGEWQLGEPDLILTMPEEYAPPPVADTYRCFVLPAGLAEDKFLAAADVLPGNRQIVHHVLLFQDSTGEAERLDAQEDGPGYTCFGAPRIPLSVFSGVGGWVPGSRVQPLPDGIGIPFAAGSRIVMQVHYHYAEGAASDRTRVGLYFARGPIERRLMAIPLLNSVFEVPAGAPAHEVNASLLVPPPFDAKLINIAPHMHLLGREIKVEAEDPEGAVRPLLYIDNWDFGWQGAYTYVEPVPLPAFTTVRLSCVYDNSESNPRNPNRPPKPVQWGEGTNDEMCLVFLGVTLDREELLLPLLPGGR